MASCKQNSIPEGEYITTFDVLGMTMDRTVNIVENNYYRRHDYFSNEGLYKIYEHYTFELNEAKDEIFLTFVGFKYDGHDSALSMIQALEQSYDAGEAQGLLADKNSATSYPFELGKNYFVIDGELYNKRPLR